MNTVFSRKMVTGLTTLLMVLLMPNISQAQFNSAPAFPGAEGYGRYTTGGRGGTVYHVTTLEDYCDNTDYSSTQTKDSEISGSLRSAVKKSGARIIVFDVAGTIELKAPLKIANDNITILGQTAPGNGICLKNYTVSINANNVIIRYIRCRLGSDGRRYYSSGTALSGTDQIVEDDAMNAYHKTGSEVSNIIIDHCSISWSVDECGSFYGNKDFTLQWCMLTESLKNAGHTKGAHGYGGIWGGERASFHHNLIADHDSRNPRFDHGYVSTLAGPVDYTNNVLYNWGGNSAYGGENKSGETSKKFNMINNYYRYGGATSDKDRLLNPTTYCDNCNSSDATGVVPGTFYISGNYMYGSSTVTNDNTCSSAIVMDSEGLSYSDWKSGGYISNTKFQATTQDFGSYNNISIQSAETSYNKVLDYAGASYSRDATDTRVCNDAKNGTTSYTTGAAGSNGATGGLIDQPTDVGGYPTLTGTKATDTDNDGIPDEWETKYGLDNSTDNSATYTLDSKGYYTDLEVYANSLVEEITKAERADASETFTEYYPLDGSSEDIKSSDATLSALSAGSNTLSPTFSANTTSYTCVLPAETTSVPTVTATVNYSKATVSITQATSTTGTATVMVTAEDGSTKTYTIQFSVASSSSSTTIEETIFSLSVVPATDVVNVNKTESIGISSTMATITGGSAIIYNGKDSAADMVKNSAIQLGGSSSSYLMVTLTDNTLAKGDVISITNTGNWKVTNTDSNSSAMTLTMPYTITGSESQTLVGKNTFYLWKTGTTDDPSSITEIEITRTVISIEEEDHTPVKVTSKKKFDFIVGKDGDADAAIAAANAASGSDRYYIFVPNGTYDMSTTQTWTLGSDKSSITGTDGSTVSPGSSFSNNAIWLTRSNVSIIGQSMSGTVLRNTPIYPGISYTSTLEIRSGKTNTYLQDFTLYNNYASGANDKGVAVAFYDRGTNTILKNVSCWSNQDTYTSAATRCYYETSSFAGTVDFICGSGDVWFEKCNIVINNRTTANVITAPSTASTENWGYVFNSCTVSGENSSAISNQGGKYNLGRPWKNAPASTFLNTTFNLLPSDAGWTNMSSGLAVRFHEYGSMNSSGTVLDLSSRSVSACVGATSDDPVLTAAQAATYTVNAVVGNSGAWKPKDYTQQTSVSNVQLSGSTLSWDDSDYALCWFIFKDGSYYDNVITNSITLTESGSYTVRAANFMGGLGTESSAVSYVDDTSGTIEATVKMTYVDGSNTATSHGEVTTSKAGYNAISNNSVALANSGWGCNWITYIQVDASSIPTNRYISKATLTASVSGSTDSKRTTTWGIGYNGSAWSSTMTYESADKSIVTCGETASTSTKSATTFETKTFDITDALKYDVDKVATILVYETAAAGGHIKDVSVSVEYTNVAPTFTVTFMNGSETFETQTINFNSTVSAPTTSPTKDGYTFSGWSETEDGDILTFPYIVTADKTFYAVFEESTPTSTITTWDFSKFTEQVTLADDNVTVEYDGLTLVGNTTANYTNDYVSSTGFHMNGTSSATTRYIKYTPTVNGTMTVTYRSNNASATDRITAIGTSVEIGSDVNTLLAKDAVMNAGYTNGATAMTISAYLKAGTKYYVYFANGGQTITKLEFATSYLTLQPKKTDSYTTGVYAKVKVNRAFKAGYSSLCVPFNTTVSEFTNNDENAYVAYLSNAEKDANGVYTLTFTNTQTIEANKPYIIYLSQALETPTVSNVTVDTENPQTITVGEWTMEGNYSIGKSMAGLYGVANNSSIMKGGSSSTLNGLAAFLSGPAGATAKAAFTNLDDDDDISTSIASVAAEGALSIKEIYSSNGIRQSSLQFGMNIVKMSDGTVRKVYVKH